MVLYQHLKLSNGMRLIIILRQELITCTKFGYSESDYYFSKCIMPDKRQTNVGHGQIMSLCCAAIEIEG